MMLEYHAAYFPIEDGWYMAQVLDFPGVVTQGRDLKHAKRMLHDALREMTMWYLEDGKALPRPDPKSRARKAALQEPIRVSVRIQSGAMA